MAITLSDGVTTIDLPIDLQWTDKYSWSAVEQEKTFSITGKQIVDQGVKVKGRPFTLVSNGGAWVSRATVDAIFEFYNTPDAVFTLTIGADSWSFQFDRPDGFDAKEPGPAIRLADELQSPDHYYEITIKGFEV